eukprot:gnl/TRDRNA2_/TRDRNA2_173633_c4_seq7.p1 gnl/TRDRNA2_/TRDRNA2_173633_c4~~gnl/TRDRNA2_/TRDRNA2_173633_c4_seq7.p1  ORF type:complete len:264 (-),score=38.43 gnl/TRDRNA2_/TRDRNA2_173633_c4_seq7:210-1001(-)
MALFWCFVMIGVILFVFSLLFMQGFTGLLQSDTELDESKIDQIQNAFGSVAMTMITLYQTVVGGSEWFDLIRLSGSFYAFGFILFIGFFNFALFNILTGLFVEQALQAAQPDEEAVLFKQRVDELRARDAMLDFCSGMDADGSGSLSREEFAEHVKTPKGRHVMKLQGIDVQDAESFFQFLLNANGEEELNLELFTDCALKMRGFAKSMDLQILHYEVKRIQQAQGSFAADCTAQLKSLSASLKYLIDAGKPSGFPQDLARDT